MPDLPRGTVTFLFTDIEGSTRLWEDHPDAMRLALARHDALMQAAIKAYEGVTFKTIGDAFCAAFHTASDALQAALTAQQTLSAEVWPEPVNIKVRMALHTGTAEVRDNDYFGQPLNRIARLLSAGSGGQTLLSLATEELIRDTLPPSVSIRDLGMHRLRDLARSEQIFQLLHPSLPSEFPTLKTLENPTLPNNLPLQRTSFIGREKEIVQVKTLLQNARLLTLTGSGGCGKTRLALQVAADVLEDYPDGVWLVELAPLVDPALVPQTVSSVLGMKEQPGIPPQRTLTESLQSKRLLLLLDNCEHLLLGCAHLVVALLCACPGLKVLATSREALGTAGEQSYRVPSLSLPDPKQSSSAQSVSHYEAVRLFIARAMLVKSDFKVTNRNAPALAQLCYHLDGIPLAIELAAARVRSLSVEDINARLDSRFRLLTGGDRTALPRQQTLRALIDWSYDLLKTPEQRLLARLSVFAGGWTLDAAESVCGDFPFSISGVPLRPTSDQIENELILDLMTSLVDKSLVMADAQVGSVRYRMLETVRQYAAERLQEIGEAAWVKSRHRDFFMALAEEAAPQLEGPEQQHWLEHLETEHDNLRTALTWCDEEEKGVEQSLRLSGALWRFWITRGHWSEAREHLEGALGRKDARDISKARAAVLRGAGVLADYQGDYAGARARYEEYLRLNRELGDKLGIAQAHNCLGLVATRQGDYKAAWTLNEEGLHLFRELGDKNGIAYALNILGNLSYSQGDYVGARTQFEECLRLWRELGDTCGIAVGLNNLGEMSYQHGHYEVARTQLEESLQLLEVLGDKRGTAIALNNLGNVSCEQGDYAEARTQQQKSLRLNRELGDKGGIANALEGLARALSAQSNSSQAVCLWGAAALLRRSIGAPLPPNEQERYDKQVAQVHMTLGENAFSIAWEEGSSMTLEQVLENAQREEK